MDAWDAFDKKMKTAQRLHDEGNEKIGQGFKGFVVVRRDRNGICCTV